MALTRKFKDNIANRMKRDAEVRRGAIADSINEMLRGDHGAGRAMLRDYVNATLGFAELSKRTGIPNKSLQRMLGPRGNPTAENFFKLLFALQRNERVALKVRIRKPALKA